MSKYDTVPRRVIDKLLKTAIPGEDGCLLYGAGKLRSDGYAQTGWKDADGRYVQGRAHRIVWTAINGPIPEGLALDHTCHDAKVCKGGPTCPHRACINPAHLRAVTSRENAQNRVSSGPRAKDPARCVRGHEYTPENTYLRDNGKRQCRACERARWRARKAAR